MNGGKDVKIGHDKRPVSVIPSDEQPLYNIQNGELLTDEFGNQLITKVDQFFLPDASSERATSVVFPENPEDKYTIKTVTQVAISTATYGIDLDVNTKINTSNKVEVLNKMKARTLTQEEKNKLALDAMLIRAGITPDSKEAKEFDYDEETIEDILEPKRKEDKGDDLWKVFNIVQEKITQGDFSAALRGAKVRKVRKIKSFEKDLKVNQDLFKLATSLVAA